jgi:hypothetical protein
MLGFVDKRDSQINWCLISKPHLLSTGDLESNAAWKSLYGVPQIVANPASNMTTSTVNVVAFTSQRHFSGPKDGLNGKQPHLHSLTVTMSQKSSFLQPAKAAESSSGSPSQQIPRQNGLRVKSRRHSPGTRLRAT